jgi:uncharacterized protein with PIN domain
MCEDWMAVLFPEGHVQQTQEEVEAGLEAAKEVERQRIAAFHAREAAREAEKVTNRCPKCAGAGYLSQFAYHKGGECFACGGTGVFAQYRG